MPNEIIKDNFNQVYSIIELHRTRALQEVNNNSLFIAWNVGGYVSQKIKSAEWGSSVVTELSEYLRTKDPSLKGYSRRNIYMMVKFYETYSAPAFVQILSQFKLNDSYLLPESIEKQGTQIVQFEIAQMPKVLLLINWTCRQQILNGCKFNEQRLFYILYAQKERFEVKELQRAIKTNSYESILGNRDFQSLALQETYPAASTVFKDTAYLEEANREVVKYALNRSMSPTMVAEYKEKLIPQETLQHSLEEFVGAMER